MSVNDKRSTVAELGEEVGDDPRYISVPEGSIQLEELTGTFGDVQVQFDEKGLDSLGLFFGVQKGLLPELPHELRNEVVRWFIDKEGGDLLLSVADERFIRGVYPGDMQIIPRERIVEVIQKVFKGSDPVIVHDPSPDQVFADVLAADKTAAPHTEVGDVTTGGVRFLTHVAPWSGHGGKNPQVSAFIERLACTNGMTHTEEIGKISLKGQTVDDIIEEMEEKARWLLDSKVPRLLEQFVSLSHREVGDPEQLLRQWGRENAIADGLLVNIIERVPSLETPISEYSLINLATSFQHPDVAQGDIRPTQLRRLQEMGGRVAALQEARCLSCGHSVTG